MMNRECDLEIHSSRSLYEVTKGTMLMKGGTILKTCMLAAVLMFASLAWASPWALPVRAAVEKVGVHVGGRAAGEVVAHGGAALAAATARHEAAKAAARAAAVKVVEKSTPGKILAAGAGTALVVGAHEAADGVQAMGTSVGKAVEDNPEAAACLGREMLSLPKTAVGIVAVFAMALLAWLLWPFIALMRNWIRLMAARRARMLETMSVVEDFKQEAGNLGAPGFARVGLLWIAAFLLLSAVGIWRLAVDGDGQYDGALCKVQMMFHDEGTRSRIASRAKAVEGLRKEYEEEVCRIHREFLAKVDATAVAEFGRVRAGIPGVVEKFGTMSRCAELVKTVAIDKWKGGSRTEASVNKDLEVSYYAKLYSARDNVAGCLQDLTSNLESARRAFAVQLKDELALGELPGDGGYRAMLVECGERIEKSKRDLAVGQIAAGVSVAFEAVCIRQTVAVVSSLLGKAAARQVGTMAAGAGAAAIDGPLPIGDIVGGIAVLGCTAWTGWDVYKATKVLPANLAKTLDSVTRDCERQCRDEVLKTGEKLVANFL